ncbi:MAG: efflux RND transporter periplasmic adaptor subunit [Patescibacteria group bacterium]
MGFIRVLLKFLKKLNKRTKIVLVITLLVVIGFLLFPKKQNEPIKLHKVERGEIKQVIAGPGVLTGKQVVDMRFPLSGKLVYLSVAPGDMVTKGEQLAALDTTTLNATYQQALNTLRDKEATVQNIYDQVKDHTGDETYAQKAIRTTAEVSRDNAYDAVKSAQKSLRDAKLFTPINGIVSAQAALVVGQNITSSDLISQIVDFSEKWFWADIDENDVGDIKIGQKAEITLNSYGDKVFTGVVKNIVPQTKKSDSGATVVVVKILLEDADLLSVNGINGQVNIITSEKKDVLIIPQTAIIGDNEVLVKVGNNFEKKKLELGIMSDTDVEVVSGISEFDEVLTNPEAVK